MKIPKLEKPRYNILTELTNKQKLITTLLSFNHKNRKRGA